MTKSDFANRPANPKNFRLTERDGWILEAIHRFDGMLSPSQVTRLFFNPSTGLRQALHRLSLLWENGYVKRPNRRKRAALSQLVYFLDKKGAEYVDGLVGESISNFKWREKPRWSLVEHDLAANNFIIDVMKSCREYPHLDLEEWMLSGEFWANPDEVTYTDHEGKRSKRRIRPDAYLLVSFRRGDGKLDYFRFLVEVDMRSEDNPRIGREKVLPGIAYVQSDIYERRFGHKSGKFLFVTTGERRALNMKRQTEAVVRGLMKNRPENKVRELMGTFHFTWFDQVTSKTVLTTPIWYQGGQEDLVALFEI